MNEYELSVCINSCDLVLQPKKDPHLIVWQVLHGNDNVIAGHHSQWKKSIFQHMPAESMQMFTAMRKQVVFFLIQFSSASADDYIQKSHCSYGPLG